MSGKRIKKVKPVENEVEKILAKKMNSTSRNEVLYEVKWKGFNSSYNTWEPLKNLTKCEELLSKFERDLKANEIKEGKKPAVEKASSKQALSKKALKKVETKVPVSKRRQMDQHAATEVNAKKRMRGAVPSALPSMNVRLERMPSGFNKGWEVEKVIGATEQHGRLQFMIKWKEQGQHEMVSNKVAREKIPQLLINFYEGNIRFNPTPKK